MGLTFEWDQKKARSNALKHGITFAEAVTVFADPHTLTIVDHRHSEAEDRFATLGRSVSGKMLVVVHTDRGDNLRIISARPASRRERKQYEATN